MTKDPLTPARRAALEVLAYGRRHRCPVRESNVTTKPAHYRSHPLTVYWQTVKWLLEFELAVMVNREGERWLHLTSAGIAYCEGHEIQTREGCK